MTIRVPTAPFPSSQISCLFSPWDPESHFLLILDLLSPLTSVPAKKDHVWSGVEGKSLSDGPPIHAHGAMEDYPLRLTVDFALILRKMPPYKMKCSDIAGKCLVSHLDACGLLGRAWEVGRVCPPSPLAPLPPGLLCPLAT